MARVRVEAPARLHLGMLAVASDGERRFGGLGVSVDRPAVVLEAEPADELSAEGPDAERALTFAHRCRDALGLAGGAHLRVVEAIPQHVGLGSGTKLALAVAQALAALEGRDVDAPGLAEASGRAARSAVGMWTFALGGLVVEGGHRPGVERPAPLLARHPMPEEWRAVLVVPAAAPGLSGGAEEAAFERLVPAPERSAVIAQLVLTSLLPALVERELDEFGAALTRVQELVGDSFAARAGRALPSARGPARRCAVALRCGGRRPELVGAGGLRHRRQRGGRARARPPHGGRRRRGQRRARGVRQPRRPPRALMKLLVSVVDDGRGARGRRGGRRHRRRQEPCRGLAGRADAGGDRGRAGGRARGTAGQRRDRRHARSARHGSARRPRRGAQRRDVREGRAVGRLDRARRGRSASRGLRRRRERAGRGGGGGGLCGRPARGTRAARARAAAARRARGGRRCLPARHRGQGRPRAAGVALARRARVAGRGCPCRGSTGGARRRPARRGPARGP